MIFKYMKKNASIEEQQAYSVLQNSCGIEIGDYVRITRNAKDYEMGWNNIWPESFNNYINKQFQVVSIYDDAKGIALDTGEFSIFPFFILEKINRPFQKNDWVVAKKSCTISPTYNQSSFIKGNLYQVDTVEYISKLLFPSGLLKFKLDENGHTGNGWDIPNFRHATNDEIFEHLKNQLPDYCKIGNLIKTKHNVVNKISDIRLYNGKNEIVSFNISNYYNNHGKCLIIETQNNDQYNVENILEYKENKLPIINGKYGKYNQETEYFEYGDIKISEYFINDVMELKNFENSDEFKIESITINSNIQISIKEIEQMHNYIKSLY